MKKQKKMTIKQFERAVNRYGAELSRWPQELDADAARTLIEENDKARRFLREAEAIERALDAYVAPAADQGLAARISERAIKPRGLEKRRKETASDKKQAAGSGFKRSGLRHPGFLYGAALASALLFLAIVPRLDQTELATSRVSLPVRTTAVEPLLAEWDAMSLAAQQEMQQAEALFGELKILPENPEGVDRETIEAFLLELEAMAVTSPRPEPDSLWQNFAAGYINE